MSEIRRGYKQTEVGVIPEDWGVSFVRDLVRSGPKNGYSAPSGDSISGTPTLSLAATSSGRMLLNETTVKNLVQTIPSSSPLFLESGDVLVQRSNTADLVGTTAVFNGPSGTYIYPDLMMRLRFHSRSTGEWFWRYANSSNGRAFFRGAAAGSTGTMPKISGEALRSMPVPIAPRPEEEAIAEALSDADALIESLEQLLTKKRQIKQGAMQELLTGKKRLPGFQSKPGYKQTEVGVIPEDWEVQRFGNVATITTGRKDVNEGNPFGQYPFFTCSRSNTFSDDYSFDCEAILIAGNGEVGNLHYCFGKFEAYQRTYVVQDFSCHIQYLWFQLQRTLADSLGLGKIGSSIPYIKRTNLTEFRFPIPETKSEQTAIATVLSDMDADIAALETKLTKARQIKQGMMQNLLTGKIRLV